MLRNGRILPSYNIDGMYRYVTPPADKMYPNVTYTVNNWAGDEGPGFIQNL
jgi:hypothetical protein